MTKKLVVRMIVEIRTRIVTYDRDHIMMRMNQELVVDDLGQTILIVEKVKFQGKEVMKRRRIPRVMKINVRCRGSLSVGYFMRKYHYVL